MADTGTVDVARVRTALADVDTSEFSDATIEQKLRQAEVIVEASLSASEIADLPQNHYETAVVQTAAYRTYSSAPAEMKREALDLSVTYDVQTYVNRLRDDREYWLSLIGVTRGGSSAAIADHTDGVF